MRVYDEKNPKIGGVAITCAYVYVHVFVDLR